MFAQRVAEFVLVLLLVARLVDAQDNLPIRINITTVSGDGSNTCPPNDQLEEARNATGSNVLDIIREKILLPQQGTLENPVSSCAALPNSYPSGYYWIQASDSSTATQVYCDMNRTCSCDGTGAWMRVANLDMTDPNQQCPSAFTLVTDPRSCGRADFGGCISTNFSVHDVEYSRVCGRVISYQFSHIDAFDNSGTTIDDVYVEGVSLTHGSSPRNHIWTFAGATDETRSDTRVCPCTRPDLPYTGTVPSFIGQDYFCETGSRGVQQNIFYPDDPLWDGQGCGPVSTCCNHPPYFCKQLPQPTTDDIELRLCACCPGEDTPLVVVEIYVQ